MAGAGNDFGTKGTVFMWAIVAFILFLILVISIYNMNMDQVNPVG